MKLWPRRKAEQRSALTGAIVPETGFPIIAGSGYSNVDGSVISIAEQSVAVRSAVDLIASICSELPRDVYTGKGAKKREVAAPSYFDDLGGDGYGTQDWIYQLVYSWLYRGNTYAAALDQSSTGMLRQATLFHPDCVYPLEDGRGGFEWYANNTVVPAGMMRHWRVNPVPGVLLGLSPIRAHATTIGVNIASNRFGKSWFDSEAHPSGILRNTRKPLSPEQSATVKRRFMEALFGGQNRREPIVMGEAWEWQGIQVNPDESQFLQTLGLSASECARIFGPGVAETLGYETGGAMTYANVQDKDIQLLKYAVNKWLTRTERVLSQFLPRPQYVIINREALLQTNTLARYQAHAIALGNKPWMEYPEVREIEDLPERTIPAVAPAVPVEPEPGADDTDPIKQESEVPAP